MRDLIHSENARLAELMRSESARIDQKPDRISETLTAVIGDHEQRIRAI